MVTGVTRGGVAYTPEFVMDINQASCIGCGRCFKVCPRDVFDLIEREGVAAEEADDYEDDYDDYSDNDDDGFSDDTAMVMSLKDALDCIGCGACARICPKQCFTHQPLAATA
jgi:Nif-specific ferredoxin III